MNRVIFVVLLILMQERPILNQETAIPDQENRLVGAYYNLDTYQSTLTFNHKGSRPLEMFVTLFNTTGERLNLEPIRVAEASHLTVDLRGLVGNRRRRFSEGSLEIRHYGKPLEVGARIELLNRRASLLFDEQLQMPKADSSELEGLWTIPLHESEFSLILCNTADQGQSVTLRMTAENHREWTERFWLGSRETRVLRRRQHAPMDRLLSSARLGGISAMYSGQPGSLLIRGMIADSGVGYSTVTEFSDPAKARSSELHGAGLRIGQVNGERLFPVLIARNHSVEKSVVKVRIPIRARGRTRVVHLPKVVLSPGEFKRFDSEIMRELSELPHGISDIQSAGIELRYSSRPGSVIAMAHSVSERKNHVFRVPLIDPATLPSSAGGYPWRVERGVTTIFHVKNVSSKRQTHSWQLDFDGGVYASGLKVVGPGDTRTIDIRELLVRQIPDIHGNVIPLRAGSGQIRWSAHSTGRAGLIARTEEVDMLTGVNSTYSCLNCCPDSYLDSYLLPSSDDGPISDTSQFTAFQINKNCYGTTGAAIVPSNVRWRSSNTGTATVNSSGLVTHKYPGSASIEGEWHVKTWEPLFESQICSLSLRFTAETAQVRVRPTVSISSNYTRIPLARSHQSNVHTFIYLTGGGYPTSGSYRWTTTSNKVTLSNTSSQSVTVHSAGASVSRNDVTVKLTYTLNGQSATATQRLTVVKPASLTASSTSKGSYDCSEFNLDCSNYRRVIN